MNPIPPVSVKGVYRVDGVDSRSDKEKDRHNVREARLAKLGMSSETKKAHTVEKAHTENRPPISSRPLRKGLQSKLSTNLD